MHIFYWPFGFLIFLVIPLLAVIITEQYSTSKQIAKVSKIALVT